MEIAGHLVQIMRYELTAPASAFETAVKALVARIEEDGLPDVLYYSLHVDADTGTAGGVIVYGTPEAFLRHHEMMVTFEEAEVFRTTHRLIELSFIGNLSAAVRARLAESKTEYTYRGPAVGGFLR